MPPNHKTERALWDVPDVADVNLVREYDGGSACLLATGTLCSGEDHQRMTRANADCVGGTEAHQSPAPGLLHATPLLPGGSRRWQERPRQIEHPTNRLVLTVGGPRAWDHGVPALRTTPHGPAPPGPGHLPP